MISVRMKGDLARQIRQMKARAGDYGPVLAAYAAPKLKTLIDDGFRRRTDPGGTPWAPLAESTVERKTKARRPAVLVWSGKLRNEITVTHVTGTPTLKVAYSPATNYGQYHQWTDANDGRAHTYMSASRKYIPGFVPKTFKRRMPLRRFLPFGGESYAPRTMRHGKMAAWFEAVQKKIAAYIDTGRLR